MTYEQTRLDASGIRALAAATAERIFPPAETVSWWRAIFAPPPPPYERFRHLCERFTSGEHVQHPFTKVKEGLSLRLRSDGIIERAYYTLQQDHIASYTDAREASDEDLLLADYYWELEWTNGRDRRVRASRGRLTVARRGDGLRRLLEGLR